MASSHLLFLTIALCMVLNVHAYVNPLEYRASSPLIARERAALLPNAEQQLGKRDYCGGMYCDCPNECIDDNTCTTNVALLPCPGGGGGMSCEAGKQVCPDGDGCCGINEICDDEKNTCLGCDAGSTICGDNCCGAGSTCLYGVCQGGTADKTESRTSTPLSSTSSSGKPSASNTPPASATGNGANGADATLSSTGGSGGKSTSTPNGAAFTSGDSVRKCLALIVLGWSVIWL